MAEQQIDRERRAMWRQIATDAGDDPYANTLHPDEVLALLDQLDQAEARIEAWEKQYDHDLAQADLIADQAEARIAEEKRLRMKATAAATRAEARSPYLVDGRDPIDLVRERTEKEKA